MIKSRLVDVSNAWVKSGNPGSDNEYNDYIVSHDGKLMAQGSADIAICGNKRKYFLMYGNDKRDRAIWNRGQRKRKSDYRRSERRRTQIRKIRYLEVRPGVFALHAEVCKRTGKLLRCEGYTNFVPKKWRR